MPAVKTIARIKGGFQHGDQQWNADIVQAEGAGIRLRHRGLTEARIADAVETLLAANH